MRVLSEISVFLRHICIGGIVAFTICLLLFGKADIYLFLCIPVYILLNSIDALIEKILTSKIEDYETSSFFGKFFTNLFADITWPIVTALQILICFRWHKDEYVSLGWHIFETVELILIVIGCLLAIGIVSQQMTLPLH